MKSPLPYIKKHSVVLVTAAVLILLAGVGISLASDNTAKKPYEYRSYNHMDDRPGKHHKRGYLHNYNYKQ